MTAPMPRPRMLTLACVLLMGVGVSMFVSLTSLLSDWGSLELQEAVESALESDVGVDMSVDTALAWLRIVCTVLLVMTIALTILAIWAMRGDRSARVVLTALCGVGAFALSLAGPMLILPGMLLVAGIVVLWSAESRVWFDVVNGRTPPPALVARVEGGPRRAVMPPLYPGASAHGVDRRQAQAHAPVPPPRPGEIAPPPAPYAYPYPVYAASPRPRLPGAVQAATITMLVGSLLAGGVCALNALMYVVREVDPDSLVRQDGSSELLVEAMYGLEPTPRTIWITVAVSSVLALVATAAAVVALGLLLHRRVAVRPAVALSYLTVVVGVVMFPIGLVPAAAAVATLVLLARPEARAWTASRP